LVPHATGDHGFGSKLNRLVAIRVFIIEFKPNFEQPHIFISFEDFFNKYEVNLESFERWPQGYFRSNDITAINQQGKKGRNPTIKKGENKYQKTKLRRHLND
jgi:hypothetical protein